VTSKAYSLGDSGDSEFGGGEPKKKEIESVTLVSERDDMLCVTPAR
jgi:hypothetical protein